MPSLLPTHTSASLRNELNARALAWASAHRLRHDLTAGRSPSVIFGVNEDGTHGNFHPASYQAICADPDWSRRLGKAHTASLRARPRADWRWRELDCAGSSDALLMNIFCHPETLRDIRVAALLGIDPATRPTFGVRARAPLASSRADLTGRPNPTGSTDTTELDMQLSSATGGRTLLVEAKLTETDFQTARPSLVTRYRDLEAVFDVDLLPRTHATLIGEEWDEQLARMVPLKRGVTGNFLSYQLIRAVLAAYMTHCAYCVICDNRRNDLIDAWHLVQKAVRSADLRCRLQLLTWQELASVLPPSLQHFLAAKYGIAPG